MAEPIRHLTWKRHSFRAGLRLLDAYQSVAAHEPRPATVGARLRRAAQLAGAVARRPPRAHEVEPGVLVTQKDARADGITVWVGAFLESAEDSVDATVTVAGTDHTLPLLRYRFDRERVVTGFPPTHHFFHRHLDVPVTDRTDRDLTVTATVPGHRAATCTARVLPPPLEPGTRIDLLTASCYDLGTDYCGSVDDLWQRTVATDGHPDLTVLTGDQVYNDAPWWFFGLLARYTPRTYYLMKYWRGWGGEEIRAAGSVMADGPTWFLPDDHEFWNNWPQTSVTSLHSFGNIGKFVRAALQRHSPWNWWRPSRAAAPRNRAQVELYSPVHPNEWGGWSRGAFDLFASFQTPGARRDGVDAIPRGEAPDGETSDGGEEPLDNTVPLNDLFQQIDLGALQVAMLDTRTRRTRNHRNVTAQFTDPAALAEMLAVARDADVLVLAIAQPVLQAARYPAQHGWRMLLDHSLDRGMADYWTQYEEFWHGLVAARRGRPTVVICGDVHQNSIAHAPDLALVQVVASPLSLVRGFEPLDALAKAWAHLRRRGEAPQLPTVRELFTGPGDRPAPVEGRIDLLTCFPHGEAGAAHLSVERESVDGTVYRLRVTLRRRDRQNGPDEVRCFRLETGASPGTSEVTDVVEAGVGG